MARMGCTYSATVINFKDSLLMITLAMGLILHQVAYNIQALLKEIKKMEKECLK